jgi:hypothetical protein
MMMMMMMIIIIIIITTTTKTQESHLYVTGFTAQILDQFFISYKIFIRLLPRYNNLRPVEQDIQNNGPVFYIKRLLTSIL